MSLQIPHSHGFFSLHFLFLTTNSSFKRESGLPLLEHLGGIEQASSYLLSHLSRLFFSSPLAHYFKQFWHSTFLLSGAKGCGKSSLSLAISQFFAKESQVNLVKCACSELSGTRFSNITLTMNRLFQNAISTQPAVILLDDIDLICPNERHENMAILSIQVSQLLVGWLNKLKKELHAIAVIATLQNKEKVNSILTNPNIFFHHVQLHAPNAESRVQILEKMIMRRKLRPRDLDLSEIANKMEGFVGEDLEQVLGRASHTASIRWLKNEMNQRCQGEGEVVIEPQDIEEALENFTPLSLKGVKLEKGRIGWEDIGGLFEAKKMLKEALEWPTKYSFLFKSSPLQHRLG